MKYIVEFPAVKQRDDWAAKHGDAVSRVYSNNPWLAADLTDAQVCELEQQQGVKLSPDVQLKPV